MVLDTTKQRIDKLFELGLKYNGSEYVDGDFNVHWTEITCDTNKEFAEKLKSIKEEKERRYACLKGQ